MKFSTATLASDGKYNGMVWQTSKRPQFDNDIG